MQTCFPQGPMPSGALTGIPNVGFCHVMSCLRKNASRCAGSLLYKLIFAILAEMAPEWNGAMKWLLAESVFWVCTVSAKLCVCCGCGFQHLEFANYIMFDIKC
jgi:hypothetical protein